MLKATCFNSSVGILSVGTSRLYILYINVAIVSIPQSEFCPLGHERLSLAPTLVPCFNSSVGILSVGTC